MSNYYKPTQILIATISISVLIVSLFGFQGEWVLFFDLFSHFRVYLTIFSLFLFIISLIITNQLAVYSSIISLAVNFFPVAPYLFAPQTLSYERQFRLVTVNLWVYNPVKAPAIKFLRASDADVIVLNEVSPRWVEPVKTLKDIYPFQYFRTDCYERGHCQMALLSKEPWNELVSSKNEVNIPTFILARFTRMEREFSIIGTHLIYPLAKGTSALQARQIHSLSKIVNNEKGDLILTGDFNFSPWSVLHRRLISETKLKRAEGGILASWISRSLPIRLPIDHTYFRFNQGFAHMYLGPNIGSDHLPVVTDVNLGDF
ncbi:MAG: endonuclease/exonuclease/phosphatase family protein [Pseudomonadota bacterium]|nr:endonuclease/exonuclease/phosphatase family protein [Pseudomonadota bacterium]